jgi:hypothetical protein
MTPTLDDLFASPDHYLHSFEGDEAIFLPMDREAYHRSIFLDGRISPVAATSVRLPVSALVERVPAPAPTGWIFHVAHCGSTLLARALDQLSTNLVLREPVSLRQLAFAPNKERLALVLAMLSKRYQTGMPTIVKANVPVNFLLPELADFDVEAPTIFLYLGLRDFLIATLRNDRHRLWLRRITDQLAAHLGDFSPSSDAQRTAALWLAQMRAFSSAIERMPNSRSLDGEAFFAAPGRFLKPVAAHLGVPMSDDELELSVKGPLFANYSKIPDTPFNNDMRLSLKSQLETELGAELDQAQDWIEERGGEKKAARIVSEAAF